MLTPSCQKRRKRRTASCASDLRRYSRRTKYGSSRTRCSRHNEKHSPTSPSNGVKRRSTSASSTFSSLPSISPYWTPATPAITSILSSSSRPPTSATSTSIPTTWADSPPLRSITKRAKPGPSMPSSLSTPGSTSIRTASRTRGTPTTRGIPCSNTAVSS